MVAQSISSRDHSFAVKANNLILCTSFLCLQVLANWRWWLLGIGCSLFIILGLAGNIIAFILLHTPSMKSPFNQLLMSLCIFDALFLVSNVTASLGALNVNGKILLSRELCQSL